MQVSKLSVDQLKKVIGEVIDEKDLATNKDLKKIDKKFDKLFDYLDRDYLMVKRDVRQIQSHLHFPISDF